MAELDRVPADKRAASVPYVRGKYAFAQNDAAGVIWAIGKKIGCVGYAADYRKLALTVIQDAAPETKRAEYDWIFDRLFARVGAMNAAGRDSSYAGSKREFVELAAEAVLQCRYLPPQLGFDERYADAATFLADVRSTRAGEALCNDNRGLSWHDCEVLTGDLGSPHLHLSGTVLAAAHDRGIASWLVSLSHDGHMAVAFVVATGKGPTT